MAGLKHFSWHGGRSKDYKMERQIEKAWKRLNGNGEPDPMFRIGFKACHDWMYGVDGVYLCKVCNKKSFPNYGRCAFCGITKTEESS